MSHLSNPTTTLFLHGAVTAPAMSMLDHRTGVTVLVSSPKPPHKICHPHPSTGRVIWDLTNTTPTQREQLLPALIAYDKEKAKIK